MTAALRAADAGRFVLEGEVTVETVPALWPVVVAAAARGGRIDVSCSGVTQADSAAVACLLEWARLLRARGGSLHVHDMPEVMRVIMEVSDLDGIIAEAAA